MLMGGAQTVGCVSRNVPYQIQLADQWGSASPSHGQASQRGAPQQERKPVGRGSDQGEAEGNVARERPANIRGVTQSADAPGSNPPSPPLAHRAGGNRPDDRAAS